MTTMSNMTPWRIGKRALPFLLLVLTLVISSAAAQNFNQKYNLHLIGQVINDVNGAPLKNHEVTIASDTLNYPWFVYSKKVFTDNEGYYYDTVLTTLEKGALIVSTPDHQEAMHDTVVHYRFTWAENTVIFANFVLPAPPVINVYQANFTYQENPNGNNKLEYQFSDLTENAEVLCWSWSFGDSTYSQEQNPLHTFESPGLYKIVLTVYIYAGPNLEPIQSTIVKIINVTNKSYFHMGGHVFAGYFPIDKSEVFLYKIEGDEFVPIDTAMFNDTLGYFLFYQLIEGDYILKADLHPGSVLFDSFMSTYYSDKLHWDEADTIFHHSNYFEYNINLVPNEYSASAGPGSIVGQISYDPEYGGGKASAPAENVAILLYNDDGIAVDICHSDENGNFMLDQLDLQKYQVYAEVTGKTTIPVEVILEENLNGSSAVLLVIDNDYVTGAVNSGVRDHQLDARVGQVFPNPSGPVANLVVECDQPMDVTLLVTSHNGQAIISRSERLQSGRQVIRISTGMLSQGLYQLMLINEKGERVARKFIR